MSFIKNNILRYTLITVVIILLAGGGWFFHFSLTPYQVSTVQIQAHYAYQAGNDLQWQQAKIEDNYDEFTFHSFDGQGLGMGLNIVKRLCEHISIDCTLNTTKMGSEFVITFKKHYKLIRL